MARFYFPQPNESKLSMLLSRLKGKRPRPDFPREVQFQTLSTCNAKCAFCPHSQTPDEIPHGRMEDGLISKIIDECSRYNVRRISPYLTNEPLLDKRMPTILKKIRETCGVKVKTRINSNGALLTEETGQKLIDAHLDELRISVNGYSPKIYRASMGLNFQATMQNIDAFLALKKKSGAVKPEVVITTIKTKMVESELAGAATYWKDRNVSFQRHLLDNRTGEAATKDLRPESQSAKFKRDCNLFLKQAYIVENGDMIICCNDWKQSVVVGNIAKTSIKEVWNSSYFKGLLHEFYTGDFKNMEICRTCKE